MDRTTFHSGSPWEDLASYSRALRVGPQIFVAGTTATDEEGNVVGKGDAAEQTRQIFAKIERVLKRAGAELKDVVRTRIFLSDISAWQEVAEVHGETFRDIRPVATVVAVTALVDPEMLIEIEVDAVVTGLEGPG
jgi:enamine deaminase RidA (YjgF/YER057c/UK114 family)